MIDIRTTGLTETQHALAALPQVVSAAQHTIVKQLGDRYLAVLKEETPIGRGESPGQLRDAYQTEESYGADTASYRITNATPYIRYVLDGRGPVVAVNARALRFVIDGQVIYRHSVGPAAPNPFDQRAAQRMQPEIDAARQELPGLIVRMYRG